MQFFKRMFQSMTSNCCLLHMFILCNFILKNLSIFIFQFKSNLLQIFQLLVTNTDFFHSILLKIVIFLKQFVMLVCPIITFILVFLQLASKFCKLNTKFISSLN
uniref:Transmembrane protein n=1 Tax=Meloidogyne incognita TaxID=6306 RepID=A0A914M9Q6_MELIC